jgi:hypothetical protein
MGTGVLRGLGQLLGEITENPLALLSRRNQFHKPGREPGRACGDPL